ncbi:CPBP family intramembrane metalloprotease [Salinimicrobium sp. MT39]|uniref:CPBP family intramembrane metalloprotease n=1 Tax=Salinimicrobium profundisediminis TaxID=2994553 RepID=A0A9X3CZM8_9FLAO|nr:CPBP family intramembrane glutamic endopeptidase [Salinimicrobium profundisediminis]MCX2839568.1 CPBP family intramembrane metalloprotease [Salinimicrobium profundisediminis]
MFIQQAYKGKTEWWRYVIGLVIIFLGWQLFGALPWFGAVILEAGPDVLTLSQEEWMRVLDSNLNFFLLLLSFAVGLAALLFVVKYLHAQSIKDATTSRKKVDWGRFFFGFSIVAVFTVVTTLIDYNMQPEDYLWNFKTVPFLILAAIALIMVPLQTSFEEYLFRGYLMQGIGVLAGNRWVPLVITSVIFGSLHLFNPEVEKLGYIIMVYYIGTGFLLGIMTLMDEGMELALGFHAGNNLVGALLVTADWTAFETNSVLKDVSNPEAGLDILLPIVIVYPIFLFLMARTYRWTNWKERLFGKVNRPEPIKYPEEI